MFIIIEFYKPSNINYEFNGDITVHPLNAKFSIEINGICEIELELPYDKENRWKFLCGDGVIKSPTPYSEGQLFVIYDFDKGMFSLKIKARHIFFDLVNSVILDRRVENKTGQEALNVILEGTKFKGNSNINKLNTCYFVKTNKLAAINGSKDNTFISRWGGEIFLDNYNITINKEIGNDYGVKITYSKDLVNIDLNENMDGIVTRAYPFAYNDIRLPEEYVDSPLINKYREIKEEFIDMTDLKLKENDDDEGFNSEEELFNAMRERINKLFEDGIDKPKMAGNVDIACLENTEEFKFIKNLVNIGLGDTITIDHQRIGVNLKSRCIGYVWNILTKKYEDVQIGEIQSTFIDIQNNLQNRVDNIINDKTGEVIAEKINGFLDSTKTKIGATKSIAQKQHVRAIQFEDLDVNSPTFGSTMAGTQGIMISEQRTLDNKDWDYTACLNAKGLVANTLYGKILAGANSYFDLETGKIYFTKGLIKGSNMTIDLDKGRIESNMPDGSQIIIDPETGFYNKNGSTKNEYFHLSYSDEVTFEPYVLKKITLPPEFRGKKFKVNVFPIQMNSYGTKDVKFHTQVFLCDWGINFSNTTSHCDYVNGTFDCYMYSNFWDNIDKVALNGKPKMGFIVTA